MTPGLDEPTETTETTGNSRAIYLYGIARNVALTQASLGTGVGEPAQPVLLLRFQRIAAVVSETSADSHPGSQVRGLRRDMSAHTGVLNRMLEVTTILPARFGVCVPDRHLLVDRILRPQYECLDNQLTQLAGTVELTLHIEYCESTILHEVQQSQTLETTPGARFRGGSRRGFDEKLERGRQIVEAMRHRSQGEAQQILQRLRPLARDVDLGEASSELTVLKASFLVDRDNLENFDQTVEALHEEMQGRTQFNYVGPLPPYSFTRMRLPA